MKIYFKILFFLLFSFYLHGQNLTKINNFKDKLEKEVFDTSKVNLSFTIAQLYTNYNSDSSFVYFKNALTISQQNNLNHKEPESLFEIALYFENSGNYEKAIINLSEALLHFEKTNTKDKVALVNNHIGYNYSRLYKNELALEHYLKSLSINKEINDEIGIARNYRSIGNLYYYQVNYVDAKEYYNKALEIYERLKDEKGIADCYTYMGNVESDSENMDIGFEYYARSNTILEKLNDALGIAGNYNNIGYNNLSLKKYKDALIYFEKALEKLLGSNEQEFLALVYMNIAGVHINLNNFQNAIDNSVKSLELSKKYGNLSYEADNLENLSNAYLGLGNKNKALNYLKLCNTIKDSIINKNHANKAQLLHALNELEKSKYTIDELSDLAHVDKLKIESEKKIITVLIVAIFVFAILTILLFIQRYSKKNAFISLKEKNKEIYLMNNEILKQRENLKQLNATKDKLFSIIAHDLRSPFNSISGFTNLMIENNDEYDSDKRLKHLNIVKKASSNALELLDNLLNWSHLQSGSIQYSPQKVDLLKEVEGVISFVKIQAIHKQINIINNISNNVYVFADLNMLKTVLRNLISNAIKFTETGGEVEIYSEVNLDIVKISIKDTGIGIPEDVMKKLFVFEDDYSSSGTENEEGSGIGLALCKDFIDKHKGEFYVKSKVNEGSEFTFTLPIWTG